jgi:flagellar motor switch protein FliM
MSAEPQPRVQLLRFALEGERVRKAAKVLEQESPRLAAALKRAIPFLSRRNVPLTLAYTRPTHIVDLLEGIPRPIHMTHFVTAPGRARGALFLDAGAIAMFLDGVLGGNGQLLPVLNPGGLSAPQTALVAGLASGIVRAFSETLAATIGLTLECRPADVEDATAESAPIACVLEFGIETNVGRVILLLPKEVLLGSTGDSDSPATQGSDPRISSVLENVEIVLVAELGRLRMRVGEVMRLKVGDMLRLEVPVHGLVSIRADDHVLLSGRPTTNGGRIALKIAASAPERSP